MDTLALDLLITSGAAIVGILSSGYCIFHTITRMRRAQRPLPLFENADDIVFILDATGIRDRTDAADYLLTVSGVEGSDRTALETMLAARFPGVEDSWAALNCTDRVSLISSDATSILTLRREAGLIRVTISDTEQASDLPDLDRSLLAEMRHELDSLRHCTDVTPFPVWRQRPDGAITWCNRAYLNLLESVQGSIAGTWPLPDIFNLPPRGLDADGDTRVERRKVSGTFPGAPLWFDCHISQVADDMLVAAVDASAAIAAESLQEGVIQSLSKTFATLTIGLAVFDSDRRLVLFNPVLTDLTTLPVPMMLGRPSLFVFLDALRQRKKMPEPRNYREWCEQISRFDSSPDQPCHCETWHLPFGQTLRITGQPQPNGALVLLFEDITAELSLTRNFRSELDAAQSVIDTLPDAMAVFGRDGVLAMSNMAYDRLWMNDPGDLATDLTITEAARRWINKTVPSPAWAGLSHVLDGTGGNDPWTGDLRLEDGRALNCSVMPIQGGSLLARFTVTSGSPGTSLRPVPQVEAPVHISTV